MNLGSNSSEVSVLGLSTPVSFSERSAGFMWAALLYLLASRMPVQRLHRLHHVCLWFWWLPLKVSQQKVEFNSLSVCLLLFRVVQMLVRAYLRCSLS